MTIHWTLDRRAMHFYYSSNPVLLIQSHMVTRHVLDLLDILERLVVLPSDRYDTKNLQLNIPYIYNL